MVLPTEILRILYLTISKLKGEYIQKTIFTLIVEALSFKLALDFLQYLKKNKINTFGIKIMFWDRVNYEFITLQDVDAMSLYFEQQYTFVDDCMLGSLCSVQLFSGVSDLYDFTTEYLASDITGSYKLTLGSRYDRQRNSQQKIYTDRQISFINQAVGEYLRFYNEIRRIYVNGIYSPCYAQPGWSQGTFYLRSLKKFLLENPNVNITPINTAGLPLNGGGSFVSLDNTINNFLENDYVENYFE